MNAAIEDVTREGERQQQGDIAGEAVSSPVDQGEVVVLAESRSGGGIAEEDEVGPTGHQREAGHGAEEQEDNGTEAVGGDALPAEMQHRHAEEGNGDSPVSPARNGESARADDPDAAHSSTPTDQEEAVAEESTGAGNAHESPPPPAEAAEAAEAATTPSLPSLSDETREEGAELPRSEGRACDATSPAANDVNGGGSGGDGSDNNSGEGETAPRSAPLSDESGEPDAGPMAEQAGRPPTAATEKLGSAPAGDGDSTGHGDGDGPRSSNNAGGGGGDSYPGGGGEEEEDANVDAGVSARQEREGKINASSNNVQSLLATTADKPLGHRAASWAWLFPSWPGAGGKHH
ncbi:unnamed protein product [Ectocarpus fasciculatus]